MLRNVLNKQVLYHLLRSCSSDIQHFPKSSDVQHFKSSEIQHSGINTEQVVMLGGIPRERAETNDMLWNNVLQTLNDAEYPINKDDIKLLYRFDKKEAHVFGDKILIQFKAHEAKERFEEFRKRRKHHLKLDIMQSNIVKRVTYEYAAPLFQVKLQNGRSFNNVQGIAHLNQLVNSQPERNLVLYGMESETQSLKVIDKLNTLDLPRNLTIRDFVSIYENKQIGEFVLEFNEEKTKNLFKTPEVCQKLSDIGLGVFDYIEIGKIIRHLFVKSVKFDNAGNLTITLMNGESLENVTSFTQVEDSLNRSAVYTTNHDHVRAISFGGLTLEPTEDDSALVENLNAVIPNIVQDSDIENMNCTAQTVTVTFKNYEKKKELIDLRDQYRSHGIYMHHYLPKHLIKIRKKLASLSFVDHVKYENLFDFFTVILKNGRRYAKVENETHLHKLIDFSHENRLIFYGLPLFMEEQNPGNSEDETLKSNALSLKTIAINYINSLGLAHTIRGDDVVSFYKDRLTQQFAIIFRHKETKEMFLDLASQDKLAESGVSVLDFISHRKIYNHAMFKSLSYDVQTKCFNVLLRNGERVDNVKDYSHFVALLNESSNLRRFVIWDVSLDTGLSYEELYTTVLNMLSSVMTDITDTDIVKITKSKINETNEKYYIFVQITSFDRKMNLMNKYDKTIKHGLKITHIMSNNEEKEAQNLRNLPMVKKVEYRGPVENFAVYLTDGRVYNKISSAVELHNLQRDQLSNNVVVYGVPPDTSLSEVVEQLNVVLPENTLHKDDVVAVYNSGYLATVVEFRNSNAKNMLLQTKIQERLCERGLKVVAYITDSIRSALSQHEAVESVDVSSNDMFTVHLKSGQCLESVSSYGHFLDLVSGITMENGNVVV